MPDKLLLARASTAGSRRSGAPLIDCYTEKSMPQIRVLLGLIIVAIAAVLASMDSLQVASQLQPDPFGVESAQQRFAGAATRLTPLGEVGYISDLPLLTQAGMTAFLAAQYALAPRRLGPVEGSGPQQAVGNFSQPTEESKAGANAGEDVVSDLGNRGVLYTKAK
jgi:hypothetical protein